MVQHLTTNNVNGVSNFWTPAAHTETQCGWLDVPSVPGLTNWAVLRGRAVYITVPSGILVTCAHSPHYGESGPPSENVAVPGQYV